MFQSDFTLFQSDFTCTAIHTINTYHIHTYIHIYICIIHINQMYMSKDRYSGISNMDGMGIWIQESVESVKSMWMHFDVMLLRWRLCMICLQPAVKIRFLFHFWDLLRTLFHHWYRKLTWILKHLTNQNKATSVDVTTYPGKILSMVMLLF